MILWTLGEVVRKPISDEAARKKEIRRTRTGVRYVVVLVGIIEGETSASVG
jgi:hypothetical protein